MKSIFCFICVPNLPWTSCQCVTDTFSLGGQMSPLPVNSHSFSVSPRKGMTATAMGTPGCLTFQRSVSTSTALRPPSRTRPVRTSNRRISRHPTSLSPTSSPAILTPTSATLSTLTPYTSRRHRTNSRRGPAGRARTVSAHIAGAVWRVRSWAWREARPGWGGKVSAARSCCLHTHTASISRLLVITWECKTWATGWRMFKWVDQDKLMHKNVYKMRGRYVTYVRESLTWQGEKYNYLWFNYIFFYLKD